MRKLFILLFLAYPINALAQKFMIHGKDTLPYKEKMVIRKDTIYDAYKHVFVKQDTTYEGTCWSFEKFNGQIVNRIDSNCVSYGVWIRKEGSVGNYWKSVDDGSAVGSRALFNKYNQLLREEEWVFNTKNRYLVKQIDYLYGKRVVIINKPFLKFATQYELCLKAINI